MQVMQWKEVWWVWPTRGVWWAMDADKVNSSFVMENLLCTYGRSSANRTLYPILFNQLEMSLVYVILEHSQSKYFLFIRNFMTTYIHIQSLTYPHDNTHFIDNIYIHTWVEGLNVGQVYSNTLPTIKGSHISRYYFLIKWSARPAKIQISLCIRQVWSESSLCAHWVAKDMRMPRLIWVLAGRKGHFVGFVTLRLKWAVSREKAT